MGIAADFLIKHIRPYGMDAYSMVCDGRGPGTLHDFLISSGVSDGEIAAAFNTWAQVAVLEVSAQTLPQFATAANAISQARWNQFYPTGLSTIMYLNEPLLKELSYTSSQNPGQTFNFNPYEHIPVAITVSRQGNPTAEQIRVVGARLTTDNQGLCVHFNALL